MAELRETPNWHIDTWADGMHADGLSLALGGQFGAAHEAFDAALERLANAALPAVDGQLHGARITRDQSFTYVRQALSASAELSEEGLFAVAEQGLHVSARTTKRLIDLHTVTGRREKELLSEHGATLGLLGRKVVAQQVVLEQLPDYEGAGLERRDVRGAQHYFGRHGAHGYLQRGSNMYYLVSNAMHGARAERLNGAPAHMVPWLERAQVGISRAALTDRSNLQPALRTVGRIGASLRSKDTAAASIMARP
jgi:hypothetical protein